LSSYKEVQDVHQQCFTIARECLLLLDHIEIMTQQAEQKGEPVTALIEAKQRLCSLLEAAQIEEIPVNTGDEFDGAIHVPTSMVGSSGPDGRVVEVSRKGYAMKVTGRNDIILRAPEVAVSTTQADATTGSGGAR
jgi:molecular chaperone GrpE (heat shock protein)